jgi:ribokinase
MKQNPRISVLGSHTAAYLIHSQRLPLPGEYLMGKEIRQVLDGGKGSNQAFAAAKLGCKVRFFTIVGNDKEGQSFLTYCCRYGVDTAGIERCGDLSTASGYAFMDEQGTPMGVTVPGCLNEITPTFVNRHWDEIRTADIFLTQLEIPAETAVYGCKKAHEAGIMTILNPAPADSLRLEDDFSFIDIITPNEREAQTLAGLTGKDPIPPEEAAARIHAVSGIRTIIITLGGKGACIWRNGTVTYKPAYPVKAVDTSGAGDCFNAALAKMLAQECPLEEAVDYAMAASALSVMKHEVWTSYPQHNDVIKFKEMHHND